MNSEKSNEDNTPAAFWNVVIYTMFDNKESGIQTFRMYKYKNIFYKFRENINLKACEHDISLASTETDIRKKNITFFIQVNIDHGNAEFRSRMWIACDLAAWAVCCLLPLLLGWAFPAPAPSGPKDDLGLLGLRTEYINILIIKFI
jgi:hypothetical protein